MSKKIGIVLLVFGATILIWVSFASPKKEKLVDVGPFQVSMQKKQSINWLPYLGTALVAGGLVLIVTNKGSR